MPTAHVVFATITGNNEDVADIVTEKLSALGCQVTEDEGSLPDEGLDFYEDLQTLKLPGKIYGVAGSGDTFYGEYYNTTVDHFEAAFQQTGATRGATSVKINLAPDQAAIDELDHFAEQLVAAVQA
ncbi:flavodoxin [Levilactobacillus brevis]|nr:flavodoxin [Levilactobacillus brevis]